jgi:hypothetical protein
MRHPKNMTFSSRSLLSVALGVAMYAGAHAAPPEDAGALALRAKYEELAPQLQTNPYKRPLVILSSDAGNAVRGEVFAVMDFPFDRVRAGLSDPNQWCDFMILHINTKHCQASVGPKGPVLQVRVGKKTQQKLADAILLEFNYRTEMQNDKYLQIQLQAETGPMGTSAYRIGLEAIPLPNARTFMHLTYSYSVGVVGRLAMQTYLATTAKDKVGFTVVRTMATAGPVYVGGMRGSVERNAMRYYLAIQSYLAATNVPSASRSEARLTRWFSAVEQFPRQLHEMDLTEYLETKHAEIARQEMGQLPR